jgi:hypothetical protein
MRICGLLLCEHRRRWHVRDTIGPGELVTKAPLERHPNLPATVGHGTMV